MNRWVHKVAVVTGASAGIGEAIAVTLVENGLKVVGLARRLDRLQNITERLASAKGTFYPVQCDVKKEEEILKAFKFAESLGGVDIVINNAGIAYSETIIGKYIERQYRKVINIYSMCVHVCVKMETWTSSL